MAKNKIARIGSGFTLIELMIVVAIIGILASIAIPKFANLVRKSREGATKGSLGAIRSALSIYYSDMEGQFPVVTVADDSLTAMTIQGKYLAKLPNSNIADYHSISTTETDCTGGMPCPRLNDGNGWSYESFTTDINFGTVYVNCTQTDTKGTVWTNY